MRNTPSLLLVGRLGAAALALGSAPIVARAIGPDGRGETAAAIALFAIIPIFLGLGLPLELRRIVAVDDSTASVHRARRLVLLSAVLSIPAGLIAAFTIFQSFSLDARIAASIGVMLTPLTLSWICDTSVLVATRDYIGIATLQLLQPFCYLLLILTLWVSGAAQTSTVIWAYIASNAGSFIFGQLRVRPDPAGDGRRTKEMVRGSLTFAGGSLAETASNRLDQVLTLPLIGASQSGLYSVAVTVGMAPLAISQALGASAFRDLARAEGLERKKLITDSIRQVASLTVLSTAALWLAGPWLIWLLFGEEFSGAGAAIQLVSIACFASAVALQASTALIAAGKRLFLTVSQVFSLAVALASLLVLGPAFGATGAAGSALIGAVVLAVGNVALSGASWHCAVPTPKALRDAMQVLFRSKQD